MTRLLVAIIFFSALLILTAAVGAEPSTRPASISQTALAFRVDQSIAKGVRYLLSRQNKDGSWYEEPDAIGEGDDRTVGATALVTLSLLYCGESHQSDALSKSIAFLRKARPDSTYSVALRAAVFATIPEPVRGPVLRNDLAWLLKAVADKGPREGFYGYGDNGAPGDLSNSQYGVLGVWYAAQSGLEVPSAYWKRIETAWRKGQNEDGGFGYFGRDGNSYASMTAAGIATLYITNDYLHANDSLNLLRLGANLPIHNSVRWIGQYFAVDHNPGRDSRLGGKRGELDEDRIFFPRGRMRSDALYVHYMLFGYERAGEACGLTRFGEHKWYDLGADFLIRTQNYDGSWKGSFGPCVDTPYSLLFLSRGRAPVVMQKLEFGNRWNNRPRDAAGFTHFMRHAAERHMNWQIVSLDATPAELREAPILYIVSDRAIKLKSEQLDKLRRFVHEGGLLLLVNEGAKDEFTSSAVSLCKDLFPDYSFRDLGGEHWIFSGNFATKGFTDPIRGLSNGVRELAILFPSGDVSWKWHSAGGATTTKLTPYAPLANLLLYLTDKANPRTKGDSSWIDRDSSATEPNRRISLARLKYEGNWNPEPLAWERLSNILFNAQDCALKVEVIDIDKLGKQPIAHLAATTKFQFTAARQAILKKYMDDGGLLIFDSAGGNGEATIAFEAMMASLYPAVASQPLTPEHPIYMGNFPAGQKIEAFTYRRSAPGKLPATKLGRLRAYTVNNKIIALESPEDLTAALTGYPTAGITGYAPQSAVELMRNVLLWRSGK